MATATAYDDYDDPGLAYGNEDLEAWDMQAYAENRIAGMVAVRRVVMRRKDLPGCPKPSVVMRLNQNLRDLVSWYCVALSLPAVEKADVEALLDPGSEAGKKLTQAAHQFNPADYLERWEADTLAQLTHVVTIGRRCAGQTKISKWKKEQKSQSNKLANCLVRELTACRKLKTILESLPD